MARHLRDGINHVQPHLHAAVGMVSLGLGEARHTVVAVSQDLDPTAVVLLQGGKAHMVSQGSIAAAWQLGLIPLQAH
jgi:hypothetical protein